LSFAGAGTIESLSASTGVSTSTYPNMWLQGFSQDPFNANYPADVSIAWVYFADNGGTWYAYLGGTTAVSMDYTVSYYYSS
jgi:hypothetical protein